MEGSCFIVWQDGWACSNEAKLDVEKDIIINQEGVKVSKQTNTLKINSIFTGKSEITLDSLVDSVFRVDDTEALIGYRCRVVGRGGDLLILNILETIESKEIVESILNRITL